MLTHIQDEVHRFAIAFHRNKRSKRQVESELDKLPGIGPKTKEALLKHFKSVARIKNATEEEIISVVGKAKSKAVLSLKNEK